MFSENSVAAVVQTLFGLIYCMVLPKNMNFFFPTKMSCSTLLIIISSAALFHRVLTVFLTYSPKSIVKLFTYKPMCFWITSSSSSRASEKRNSFFSVTEGKTILNNKLAVVYFPGRMHCGSILQHRPKQFQIPNLRYLIFCVPSHRK